MVLVIILGHETNRLFLCRYFLNIDRIIIILHESTERGAQNLAFVVDEAKYTKRVFALVLQKRTLKFFTCLIAWDRIFTLCLPLKDGLVYYEITICLLSANC